ncbi:hypothetical protein AAG906_000077 [Vitis piasezkii]
MRGSACVEVMTTLHGRAPSLRRCAEGCVPSEGRLIRSDSHQSSDSSVETSDELATTLASIRSSWRTCSSTGFHLVLHSIWQIIMRPFHHLIILACQVLHAKHWRYSGIGYPKIHLRLYNTVMRVHGIDDAQLVALFPMSLSGAAQRWFASVEPSRLRTWEDVAHEFRLGLLLVLDIDILRVWFMQLLVLRRPLLEVYGQILILLLTVRGRSRLDHLVDLERLTLLVISIRGLRIIHLIGLLQSELISLIHSISISISRFMFRSLTLLKLACSHDHHIREDTGLIVPLVSHVLPHPIPPHFRSHEHCLYHQIQGHDTERCSALHHAIQDKIDSGLVNLAGPSVTTNPLPTHSTHAVPPPPSLQ